jgi:hypothetical protein
VVAVLQVGHYGEHLVRVTELGFFNGTLSCPPPVDNPENAQRAVDEGLRSEADPTGYSAVSIVVPDEATGQPAPGNVVGPPACGVFGQFDFEPIHLIWDTAVWLGGLFLPTRFPRNKWLWVAVVGLSRASTSREWSPGSTSSSACHSRSSGATAPQHGHF